MILFELPLALASFVFYRVMKNIMRAGLMLRDIAISKSGKSHDWVVLSADDMLARPGALPLIMTMAPRWNTHAILATLSPLPVREFIEIDTETANRSAAYWTIVVCTYAGRKTITSVSTNGNGRIPLPPHTYWLGLRYYEGRAEMRLPAIYADGRRVSSGRALAPDTNAFYRDLNKRSGLFYRALHYYVFVLVRHPRLFPESFIRRELLPLGNPETEFQWGALRKGEELRGDVEPGAFRGWNILLTVYGIDSFPIHSEQIRTHEFRFRAHANCIYLFRINRKATGDEPFPCDWLHLRVGRTNPRE